MLGHSEGHLEAASPHTLLQFSASCCAPLPTHKWPLETTPASSKTENTTKNSHSTADEGMLGFTVTFLRLVGTRPTSTQ